MTGLISIEVPCYKTTFSKSETTEVPAKPGSMFGMKTISFSEHLVPEVQAWVDDGRIVSYKINQHWRPPGPRMAIFNFVDPKAAMLFKLMYA